MPYYVSFFVALSALSLREQYSIRGQDIFITCLGIALSLFIGLRSNIGVDWDIYESWVGAVVDSDFISGSSQFDIGYGAINWIGANWFGGIFLTNLICATISVAAILFFCRSLERPFLAILVALPYLIIVVLMGYTRQAAAVSLGMMAIYCARNRDISGFLLWIGLASLFHKSAVFLLVFSPALLIGQNWSRRTVIMNITLLIAVIAWIVALFWNNFISLYIQYVSNAAPALNIEVRSAPGTGIAIALADDSQGLQSKGAILRLLQSVLAVVLFAFLSVQGKLRRQDCWVWTIASLCVICLFLLAFFKSTLADRLGLFLIPLQVFIFALFPSSVPDRWRGAAIVAVMVGCWASFFIWLYSGSYSSYWLPYRSLVFPTL